MTTRVIETVVPLPQRKGRANKAPVAVVKVNESQNKAISAPNGNRRRRGGRRRGRNAPVALGQPNHVNKVTERILISGSDRFAHIKDISTYDGQTLVMEIPITTSQFPRLETIGSNYQNWKVNSLGFRICPQVSTSTNGGYVVGYSRDPQEQVGVGADALNAITALRNSQTKKWWEDSVVMSPGAPKMLWTQETEGDERLFADGKFYLAVDGKATTPGSLTIYVDYTVELIKPVYRKENPDEEKLEDTPLSGHLAYLWEEGNSTTGYLMHVTDGGTVDNIQNAIPGLADYLKNNENHLVLWATKSIHVPGLKSDLVAEYNFVPRNYEYVDNAMDNRSGFKVRVFGQEDVSVSAYIGDEYNSTSTIPHVMGPLEGTTLREYGLINYKTDTRKHVGFEHLTNPSSRKLDSKRERRLQKHDLISETL